MTDERIRQQFAGASDFETRKLQCGDNLLHAYFIDGLVTSSAIADYIFKPIASMPPSGMQ